MLDEEEEQDKLHGPNGVGYTHATLTNTMTNEYASMSNCLKLV